MTKDEKKHLDKLARFGCVLCFYLGYGEGSPAQIHHIRRTGKRKNAPVIPLCYAHHIGDEGVHGLGRKAFEDKYDITEEELLKITQEAIDYKWQRVFDVYMGSRIQ